MFSLLSRLTNFFSIFFVFHTNPYKIERIRIFGSCLPVVSLLFILFYSQFTTLNEGSFLCHSRVRQSAQYILVLLWLILALHQCLFSLLRCHSSSFRCILVPFLSILFYCAVIPARSGTFRYHSCPFRFIPASFCLVPVYSVPFHSVPVFSNAPL